ncbi:hypothetical protein FQN55_008430 [Onygenales sp. PD_40]|nr:hypothetical protein FQN55_008430 [Onygenales sp. PD_40]
MSADEDADSRTASVGFLQGRGKDASNSGSRKTASTGSSNKRRARKIRRLARREMQDFVPKGTSFTSTSLAVEDEDSSSPSQRTDNTGDDSSADRARAPSPVARAPPAGIAPSMNWNKVGKSAIRTALRGRGQAGTANAAAATSFDAINGKYWRSRSASASTTGSNDQNHSDKTKQGLNYNGRESSGPSLDVDLAVASKGETQYSADFSDMDSGEVTDTNDDIVLNLSCPPKPGAIGSNIVGISNGQLRQENGTGTNDAIDVKMGSQDETGGPANPVATDNASLEAFSKGPKATAIKSFRSRYSSNPVTLADLTRKDLEIQAKYAFYNLAREELDLSLSVRCIDCMKDGHLSEVCPSKECEHCGAWAVHESRFCSSWMRCQRCRERGHEASNCPSPLKGSAVEEPCDFCGSSEHAEAECDFIWKLPKRTPTSGQIFISISCSYCTSSHHLLGDCPKRDFPMNSSSFSLKNYDPSILSNLNTFPHAPTGRGDASAKSSGYKIRGRASGRSPSPESDGAFGRPDNWKPISRSPQRAPIRFGNGIGRGRNYDDDTRRPQARGDDQYVPQDYRRGYRDREQFPANNTRQRSMSPARSPSRQRSGGTSNWHPARSPPRSPPLTRSRGPPPGRGRGRGGGSSRGGRGRGGAKQASNRETYRPLPSAAKKAWDQHRF